MNANYHLMCGGTPYRSGEIGGALDFGWRPSPKWMLDIAVPKLDGGTRKLFEPVMADENVPQIQGDRVFLWEWMRPIIARLPASLKAALGVHNGLPGYNWQFTGSCVNGGAYNALLTRAILELAILPDAESANLPFTLLAYGRSRYDAFGDSSEGEGSLGDAMAQALAKYGAPPIGTPGLPSPVFCGPATCYDRATELKWSSVRNQPDSVMQAAKPYPITYGIVTNPDEAEAELRKFRPLTWAGDWGGQNTGTVNSDGLLVMPRRETWNHQESVLGCIRIGGKRWWRIQNQWWAASREMQVEYTRGGYINRIVTPGVALPMHGENPDAGFNGPPGGYYVTDKDMEYQCRTGEVRSIKSFMGYHGELDFARI